MIVEVITDNKNRTVSEIRSCFTKYNGNLAVAGAVSWMFSKKGIITVDKDGVLEEKLLEIVLEVGAEDMNDEGDYFEIRTAFELFEAVKRALEDQKIKISSSEMSMIPQSTVHLDGKQAEQMLKLVEALEDHDDVQKVHANFDIDEEVLEKMT